MDAELQAYDDAWKNTPVGQRNQVCQVMADDYVRAHPELVESLKSFTIPELVSFVDLARGSGNEERRIELDIWIMAGFEFQDIGGSLSNSGTHRAIPGINPDGIRREVN